MNPYRSVRVITDPGEPLLRVLASAHGVVLFLFVLSALSSAACVIYDGAILWCSRPVLHAKDYIAIVVAVFTLCMNVRFAIWEWRRCIAPRLARRSRVVPDDGSAS